MKTNDFFENYCKENVIINFEGDEHVFTEGVAFTTSSATFSAGEKVYLKTETEKGADIVIQNEGQKLEIRQHYEIYGETIRQYNEVINHADEEKVLSHISSAMFAVPYQGILPWNDRRRFKLHVCKNAWSAEAQWRSGSLSDFGLYPIRWIEKRYQGPGRILLSSKGSWSTGVYYPLVILEDMENGVAYYMEHEGGVSWEITIGFEGGKLVFDCGSADLHLDGFCKKLQKDVPFATTTAVYGKVNGGFEEAVAELTEYKRAVSKRKWAEDRIPVCYNVYMGGIYGKPNEENLKKLIPAAKKLGCEIFCIDAGWFHREDQNWHLGDYEPCDEIFGTEGLCGIIKQITEQGMLPGLWFEFEAAGKEARFVRQNEDVMLRRNGRTISPERGFLDLTDVRVREHLLQAVERVYRMGVRYIKNDYNYSTGIGTGENVSDYNAMERRRDQAILDFIDELYRRYPDIIIENCGSGAMRADNGTLSHFHVQSTSDQELYYNYAPIAAASAAIMPPEKAGNWANPYFLGEGEYEEFDKGVDTAYLEERNLDGEATIFSMINGMLGAPIISGRIDYLDDLNVALVKEAVACFKDIRKDIVQAHAVYPTGFGYIGGRSHVTFGLVNREKTLLYLAVWKINACEEETVIDLSKYAGNHAKVERLYPVHDEKCQYKYAETTKMLTVKMPENKYMGRLFRIRL